MVCVNKGRWGVVEGGTEETHGQREDRAVALKCANVCTRTHSLRSRVAGIMSRCVWAVGVWLSTVR